MKWGIRLRYLVGLAAGRLLIACGSHQPRRGRARSPVGDEPFVVYTFVTDEAQYREMRASFQAAGFDRFERLTDTDDDPYRAIGRIDGLAVLCHQDVRCDQGYGEHELRAALDNLPDSWVVAGNAGATHTMRIVRRLVDRTGGPTRDEWPVRVATLDENFLVLRDARCSNVGGFHLYATDACLNAELDGGTAHVIDFPVTHLGGNGRLGYEPVRERFLKQWHPRFRFRYVGTPLEVLFLSRHPLLRRVFGSAKALQWVGYHRRLSERG